MRRKAKGLLKIFKRIKVFKPINIRLSFYISPLVDVSRKFFFTQDDLVDINLNEMSYTNPTLFDQTINEVDGNILALLDEGVLPGVKTGADLGIYDGYIGNITPSVDYGKVNISQLIQRIDEESDLETSFLYDDDFDFSHCILADEDPLCDESTQVVRTFKGYVEVTAGDFSYIRKCVCDNSDVSMIHIPREDVLKYQLRHGDEIVCTYIQSKDKMLMGSLLTINQQSRYKWNINRPWFKDLNICTNTAKLKGVGDYTKAIINKFGLFDGDSIFIYLNKSTQKSQVLGNLIQELYGMFDKVIYINPQYKTSSVVENFKDIIKFCAPINAESNYQATVALLGSHHARRLMELGKRVAIIIDDIEAIISLDKVYKPELPICKTLLNSAKACENSCTNFTLIPLRNYDINSFDIPRELKGFETLGVVIDYNEIDLFNSYRI